jgi:hypothetical protein
MDDHLIPYLLAILKTANLVTLERTPLYGILKTADLAVLTPAARKALTGSQDEATKSKASCGGHGLPSGSPSTTRRPLV